MSPSTNAETLIVQKPHHHKNLLLMTSTMLLRTRLRPHPGISTEAPQPHHHNHSMDNDITLSLRPPIRPRPNNHHPRDSSIVSTFKTVAGYTWVGSAYTLAHAAITPVWCSVADI
jgi:hypothetical protein